MPRSSTRAGGITVACASVRECPLTRDVPKPPRLLPLRTTPTGRIVIRVRPFAVLLVSLACVGQAEAARPPTANERAALTRVATAYVRQAPTVARIRLSIRISTVNPDWAVIDARAWDATGHPIQGTTLAGHYIKRRWTLLDVGGAALGCGVPRAVVADLHLVACPAPPLPRLYGQVRPAMVWTTGDGTAAAGGPDGHGGIALANKTSLLRAFGHIRWIRWTATQAVGLATEWVREDRPCVSQPSGCHSNDIFTYKPKSRGLMRIVVSGPANGSFGHVRFAGYCFLTHSYRGFGSAPVFVSCQTWRPQ